MKSKTAALQSDNDLNINTGAVTERKYKYYKNT